MQCSSGLGLEMNHQHATVVTLEMESQLWEQRLLGDTDPETLLNTMVYLFEM